MAKLELQSWQSVNLQLYIIKTTGWVSGMVVISTLGDINHRAGLGGGLWQEDERCWLWLRHPVAVPAEKFAPDSAAENYLKCVIKTIAHGVLPAARSYPAITRQSWHGWLYHHHRQHQRSPVRMSVITHRLRNLPSSPSQPSSPVLRAELFQNCNNGTEWAQVRLGYSLTLY